MTNSDNQKTAKRSNVLMTVLLCLVCIAVNLLGAFVSTHFHMPLYLDTVGTIVTAVYSGSLPGMVVGLITSLLRGIQDSSQLYYGTLNMCCAIVAAFFAKKGIFRNLFKPILLVPLLAVMTGCIGAVMSWFLNSGDFGGLAEPYARGIYERLGGYPFLSQLGAEVLVDLADKLIVVILAVVLIRLVPRFMKDRLQWQNVTTLSQEETARLAAETVAGNVKCRKISLKAKVLLIITAVTLMIAATATGISYILFRDSTIDEHVKLAETMTNVAVKSIDPVKVYDYSIHGEAAEGYLETEQKLYAIKDCSSEVQFLYVYRIMRDGYHVVFDLDTEEALGDNPGDVLPFDDGVNPYLKELFAGEDIPPMITVDSDGWLLTVYTPLRDASGKCRCYVGVDISMNLLSQFGYTFLAKLISAFTGFFLLALGIGAKMVDENVVRPIDTIAACADAFAYNSSDAREESVERLKALDIKSGDEVERLYNALVTTTEESMRYVSDIQTQTEKISQMQNGLILVLADIVESRDKCTGDHVHKTAAYVKIIVEEMKRLGYYKDQLTDEFVHNVINSAPLHDIGKISVPDNILNKPGKLTDEEFAAMKSHTTEGAKVLQETIDMVPESCYLEEAKNLAAYHHEKWNGKGYPFGLEGEQIPLSARIMAVADVFDALVSSRSYKKPFSFDMAMNIIREDAGTHFDPLVAQAFLSAQDQVKEVMAEFDKMSNPNGEEIDTDGSTDQKR